MSKVSSPSLLMMVCFSALRVWLLSAAADRFSASVSALVPALKVCPPGFSLVHHIAEVVNIALDIAQRFQARSEFVFLDDRPVEETRRLHGGGYP